MLDLDSKHDIVCNHIRLKYQIVIFNFKKNELTSLPTH